jgi:hypothetical protein
MGQGVLPRTARGGELVWPDGSHNTCSTLGPFGGILRNCDSWSGTQSVSFEQRVWLGDALACLGAGSFVGASMDGAENVLGRRGATGPPD